jgi:hypothetical protein
MRRDKLAKTMAMQRPPRPATTTLTMPIPPYGAKTVGIRKTPEPTTLPTTSDQLRQNPNDGRAVIWVITLVHQEEWLGRRAAACSYDYHNRSNTLAIPENCPTASPRWEARVRTGSQRASSCHVERRL